MAVKLNLQKPVSRKNLYNVFLTQIGLSLINSHVAIHVFKSRHDTSQFSLKTSLEKVKIDNRLSRSLKITEKVSFNIASEASYAFILNRQNVLKNAKNSQFGEFLKI